MNWLDLAVIGIIVLSAVFAFARGFVREAFSVVAWAGAAAVTFYAFGWAYDHVEPHVHNPLLSQVIAGFGLFVVSLVVLTMLTGIVARMLHATGLSPIDRTLGFVFGIARGMFLVCLAYLLVAMALPAADWPPWLREAQSRPYLNEGAELLKGFLPDSLQIKNTEDTAKPVDPAVAAERAMRALANPTPPAAAKPETAPAPNYRQQNRRELDRLIGTQR